MLIQLSKLIAITRHPLICRYVSNCHQLVDNKYSYLDSNDRKVFDLIKDSFRVIDDFVTEEEEQCLLREIEPYVKRLRYESSHWDDAIHEYRETERSVWTQDNQKIIDRVRQTAFPSGVAPIRSVHVLDLAKHGVIKAHVDAVRVGPHSVIHSTIHSFIFISILCDNQMNCWISSVATLLLAYRCCPHLS